MNLFDAITDAAIVVALLSAGCIIALELVARMPARSTSSAEYVSSRPRDDGPNLSPLTVRSSDQCMSHCRRYGDIW